MSFQIQLGNRYTGGLFFFFSLAAQKKPSACVRPDYCKMFVFVERHSSTDEHLLLCSGVSVGLFCFFLSWVVIFNDSLKCCCSLSIVHLVFNCLWVLCHPTCLLCDQIQFEMCILHFLEMPIAITASGCSFILIPEWWHSLNLPEILFNVLISGHRDYK